MIAAAGRATRLGAAGALFVCTFVSLCAYADDEHYQNFLTGGRAVTLGGAFTAIANDPSGLVFDPAGIVDDAHTDISLSANLYGFERSARGGGATSPIPPLSNLSRVATDLVIIPQASGVVRTFGKNPDGEGYLNAIGFGVFVPSYRSSSDVLAAGSDREYRRTVSDRTFMPGIGYARRIGKLRLGLSAFYVLRALSASETSSVVRNEGSGQAFRLIDTNVALTAGQLLFVLGGKYVLSPKLSFGFSASLPTIPINNDAEVRYRKGFFDQSVSADGQFNSINKRLPSGWRYTPNLRFGMAYVEPALFTLSLDVAMHFPMRYQLVQLDSSLVQNQLPFPNDITRHSVVNFNAGAEFIVWKSLTIGGGLFTDFSSSDKLSGPRFAGALASARTPAVDVYGLSATIGYLSDFTITRLGVTYSFGQGHDVVAEDNAARLSDGITSYRRIEYFTSFFYVFVSSTLRFL